MSDECKHGSLRRSCEICERDVEIERLRAELAEKDKRIEELEENIRTVVEDPYYLRFLGNALKEKNNADAT